MTPTDQAIRDFLRDHPEHSGGVRQAVVEAGKPKQTVLDTPTTLAFAEWCIRTRRGDPDKARALIQALKEFTK